MQGLADMLWAAEHRRQPCEPLTTVQPGLTLPDAYRIQGLLTARHAEHSRQIGWKIGVTSSAVQKWLNIDHPDFGALFADMEVQDGGVVWLDSLLAPRVEGEVAFVMRRTLRGPAIGMAELLRSVDFAVAAIEIIDTRIRDWKIQAADTIADNGSSARFVVGCRPLPLADMDLKLVGVTMRVNGEVWSTGAGAACMGNPLNALLWLVNELGRQGHPIRAGQVVLSGAVSEVCIPKAGDHVEVSVGPLGRVEVRFA